jgi:Fe2+ transport system protein B
MICNLLHYSCSTTIFTIYKEIKNIKWTLGSSLLSLVMGFAVTFFVTQIWIWFTN